MSGNMLFMPYEGSRPFLFISYAHRDTALVLPAIRVLHDRRYRLWYDEGIPAGSDWPQNIAEHMRLSAAVLFFISDHALASPNCLNEIREARRQEKPVLCIRIGEGVPPQRWAALLDGAPVLKFQSPPEALAEAVLQSGIVTERFLGDGTSDGNRGGRGGQFNGWIAAIVLGALLLVAAGAGMYGLSNGWFAAYFPAQPMAAIPTQRPTATPVPTPAPTVDLGAWESTFASVAVFDDALSERAVRNALDQPEGDVMTADLLSITQLHLCGSMALQSGAGIAYDGDACTVNGAPVLQGPVRDLRLYGELAALVELTLAFEDVSSVSGLEGLTLLARLDLSGNPLASVDGLHDMPSLSELNLSHTEVTDLTPLNALPSLRTVYVNAEMVPLVTRPEDQRYEIVLVK